MIRTILALALAGALSACATIPGVPAAPGMVADRTVIDEKVATGVELAYKAARLSIETATDAGLITGPRAAQVAAADNRAYAAVKAVRAAYDAGNSATYGDAATQAQAAVAALLAAIKGN